MKKLIGLCFIIPAFLLAGCGGAGEPSATTAHDVTPQQSESVTVIQGASQVPPTAEPTPAPISPSPAPPAGPGIDPVPPSGPVIPPAGPFVPVPPTPPIPTPLPPSTPPKPPTQKPPKPPTPIPPTPPTPPTPTPPTPIPPIPPTPIPPIPPTPIPPTQPTPPTPPIPPAPPGYTATQLTQAMGRGINYGQYHEISIAAPIPTAHLDAIVNAGFKNIRIPVKWLGSAGMAGQISPAYLAAIDESVKRALDRGLIVMINVHHEDWLANPYGPAQLEKLRSIWRVVGAHFRNTSYRLAFEIDNEPPGFKAGSPAGMSTSQVNEMNQAILRVIRQELGDTNRVVFFAVSAWNQTQNIVYLDMGQNFDPYVAVTVHFYHPTDFVFHQTTTWASAQYDPKTALKNEFNIASSWSLRTGYPIHLGEFGVSYGNASPPKDRASVVDFYRSVSAEARARGWPYSVWDDNGWFRVFHRSDLTWENDIRAALAN